MKYIIHWIPMGICILGGCLTEPEYTLPEEGNRRPLAEGNSNQPPPLNDSTQLGY